MTPRALAQLAFLLGRGGSAWRHSAQSACARALAAGLSVPRGDKAHDVAAVVFEAPIFIYSLTENDFLFFGQRADWMLYLQKCFVRSVAHFAFCLNMCIEHRQVISIQAMVIVINDMT